MQRIAIAFRAFFAALLNAAIAGHIRAVLDGPSLPKIDTDEKPPREQQPPSAPAPRRSEAITLLAALQREARFVDLVRQPLASFSDEQIGAAARKVLGDCSAVLDRFFAIKPVTDHEEGSTYDVPAAYDPGCYKLSGRVEGSGPFHGRLVHHGWRATVTKLPEWTGSRDSCLIIAPAEVELP